MIGFGAFASHLRASAGRTRPLIEDALMRSTAAAVQRARDYIGHDQGGASSPEVPESLPGWQPLSGATMFGFDHPYGFYIPGKIELGYAEIGDERPLEREGHLRNSISGAVQGMTSVIGSPDEIVLFQEMGTPGAMFPIPPRPVLARALLEELEPFAQRTGRAMVTLLTPDGA